ncbi:MAG: hypothetical protein D8M58_13950 [Calditrichaeota bacterium]|nr:MAG: hypothetical protein DWQ03_15190 [Calditrichota bacterium]MBL1206503.1 hypothetical protein [Calditrichota bacterium]NOG46330.1 hypothetical protein [Calditrichota bacterium]
MTNKYLEKLKELGISERESKVYLTMINKKMFSAGELQEAVDIPRTKIYEVLKKMVKRGICKEKKVGVTNIYIAEDPKIVLQKIIEYQKKDLIKKEKIAAGLSNVLSPVFEKGKENNLSQDFIEILKDKKQIHHKYLSLVNNTKNELLTFNKGPYACDTTDKAVEQQDYEMDILKRGAKSRGIYEREELENYSWLSDGLENEINLGHDARVIEKLPVKMIIFDNEAVMFALDSLESESTELTMIAIEHNSVANACRILFDFIWSQSTKLKI